MTYIENVFLCMASPLLIAALCMGKRQRKFFLFCFAGMGACLLSAYINTFFVALYKADTFAATTEIAPVVEEVMKLLPLLFYLLIFEPKAEQIKNAAVITALSFATFENVCYPTARGNVNIKITDSGLPLVISCSIIFYLSYLISKQIINKRGLRFRAT